METIILDIVNWDKHQKKRSDEYKNNWFKLWNGFFFSDSLYSLNVQEKYTFVCLLNEKSSKSTRNVHVNVMRFSKMYNIRRKVILSTIEKLSKNKTIVVFPRTESESTGCLDKIREDKIREENEKNKNVYIEKSTQAVSNSEIDQCVEVWGISLARYGIKKDPKMDAMHIGRLVQRHGVEKTKLALSGAGLELPSKDYDPASHCSILRVAKIENFERFVNLGSKIQTQSREYHDEE